MLMHYIKNSPVQPTQILRFGPMREGSGIAEYVILKN